MERAPGKIRINTLEDNIIPLVSYCQVEMSGIVQDWLNWKADKAVSNKDPIQNSVMKSKRMPC